MPFVRMHTRLLTEYGDPQVVLNRYRKAWESNPDDPVRNYQYGLILARVDQRAQAIQHLNKSLEASPLDPVVLGALGKVYFLDGQYDKAQPMLQGAVELAPRDPESRFYLGRLQQEMGQNNEAITTFDAILTYHPRHYPTHFFIGKAYSELGQQGEAFYHLGLYYYGKEQTKQAIFQLEKALALTSDEIRRKEIETLLADLKDAGKDKAAKTTRGKRTR
jgi:tetratricopeptide (TPR) repeat protein